MIINHQMPLPYWATFSPRFKSFILEPKYDKEFSPSQLNLPQYRFCEGETGSREESDFVSFKCLVNEENGVIENLCFQVYGLTVLKGLAEAASHLLIHKTYKQALKLSSDLILKSFTDVTTGHGVSKEFHPLINVVLEAIDQAVSSCHDIIDIPTFESPPLVEDLFSSEGLYPDWDKLSQTEQISVLQKVIDTDILPYLQLDEGGMKILSFTDHKDLLIAYEGSCTSCHAATGSTLTAIQQILRAKIHPDIVVIPDKSFLIS
ncbi:MAG: NifU family protein [Rhabdochlamydiaceae bacterium]